MQRSNNQYQLIFLASSFNRREHTVNSVTQINNVMNNFFRNITYRIILVDDRSTDDTVKACSVLPNVRVIQTKGDLFWARSMIFGHDYIQREYPDYERLFVFNDDIHLDQKPTAEFLKEAMSTEQILIAPFHDGVGTKTYGGVIRDSRFNKLSFKQASIGHQTCDTMNTNLVSIPKTVIEKIGFFKSYFVHGGADYEYGIRAKKAQFVLLQFDRYVGVCKRNTEKDFILSEDKYILKTLVSRKYFPPITRLRYYMAHAGILGTVFFWSPYLRGIKHDISIFLACK